jgi:hypothetical protein
MHQRRTLVLAATFATLVGGCLDASPVTVQTVDAGLVIEAGTGEDGETPVDAYAHPECRACIAADPVPGPGCGDKLANCVTGSEHCIDIYECAYALGCVTKPTQNESISCALPCAAALKITNVNDPSIQLAIRLTECFHSTCKEKCEVSDAVEIGAALREYSAR